ncbi:MAG TPA: ABC transporter ATP-binding protein [Candidatus Saccharimonadales bacterium]|nr:ABC transporter ATP-binding protein [Candidatus Saccharimonadales bacterium]
MSTLIAENLTKRYGSGESAVSALGGVSFEAKSGEVVLIMGPSGSGKTTLLLLLGTLLRPTSGRVIINGQETSKLSNHELPRLRLKEIGFVFQHFNLLSALTAEQNVMVPLLAMGISKSAARSKAREFLKRLGLEHRMTSLPQNLSGGEEQRVAIARAMANNPSIILADEPTANLDSKTGHEIVELLRKGAKDENKCVVIVSHDPRIKDIADRIINIEDGRIS